MCFTNDLSIKSMKLGKMTSLKTVFLIAFVCFVGLISCKKEAAKTDTPENTVQNYLKAIDIFDFKQANEFVVKNENTDLVIKNIERFSKSLNENERKEYVSSKKTYFIKPVSKTTDKTTLVAVNNEGIYAFGVTFKLIKKGNQWLIEDIQSDD